jgi:4-hydroxy-L-threonine phosphate dehydrogenase PdxA
MDKLKKTSYIEIKIGVNQPDHDQPNDRRHTPRDRPCRSNASYRFNMSYWSCPSCRSYPRFSPMNRIAVTMGDPAGIGGEIILKAAPRLAGRSIPVIIGDMRVFDELRSGPTSLTLPSFKGLGQGSRGDLEFLDLGFIHTVKPGLSDSHCGEASYRYIREALKLILRARIGHRYLPHKQGFPASRGTPLPGHTELLAHAAGMDSCVMMLANPR